MGVFTNALKDGLGSGEKTIGSISGLPSQLRGLLGTRSDPPARLAPPATAVECEIDMERARRERGSR